MSLGWSDPHPALVSDPLGTSEWEIPPYSSEVGMLWVIFLRERPAVRRVLLCRDTFPSDA